MKRASMEGLRFARLSVISFHHRTGKKLFFLCRCDCGTETVILGYYLRSGHTRSCGCLVRESNTVHGGFHTRLYRTWEAMIRRCESSVASTHRWYFDRGIKVCAEWRHDFACFREWALSHGYADDLTIDRIDNYGNYEPDNCQWLTNSENSKKANAQKYSRPEKRTRSHSPAISFIDGQQLFAFFAGGPGGAA